MHQQDPKFQTAPRHPNYYRRARHHDYTRPGRYMLTLRTNAGSAALSTITGTAEKHDVALSTTGMRVANALQQLSDTYPQVMVQRYAIMPDHIHICLSVRWPLPQGLGRVVARLKGDTTQLWERGYNDRIAYTDDQWLRQLRYVADNPRRYLIKKQHPEWYYSKWLLMIGDTEYVALGNIFLLKAPELQVVRFSRRYAPGVFEAHVHQWEKCVENGGVLVSPFIHPKESEVGKRALAEGGAVIRICDNGFSERFAPVGREFEYNAEGRLLLVAPLCHNTQAEKLTYGKAMGLNAVAQAIAQTDWGREPGRLRLWRR